MVNEQNVKALRNAMVACELAGQETGQAMQDLIRAAKSYHTLCLVPMRCGLGMLDGAILGGASCCESIQDGIRFLGQTGLHLPQMSVEDFCDTVMQAIDEPSY